MIGLLLCVFLQPFPFGENVTCFQYASLSSQKVDDFGWKTDEGFSAKRAAR